VLEESFLHAGLPYRLVGAQRFYGRREIKDVIAYLRLVHNPADEVSLTRVINTPARGVGDKTMLALRTQAGQLRLTPGELLLKLGGGEDTASLPAISGRMMAPLEHFGRLLVGWRSFDQGATPLSLMDRVVSDIDYQAYLEDGTEEGRDRWENVVELRRLAAEFQEAGLEAFLEQVALVSDQDTMEERTNVPTLLTLHAAKGLEFPVVFIVGLNDGTLPHSRSFDDPDGMEEERRLLYVGITRAKNRLYLAYAQNRSLYGYSEPIDPSRYLDDIPIHLVDERQPARSGRRTLRAAYGDERWQAPSPARARVTEQRFHPGLRVQHNVWGEGMVLNSRIQDDDEIVDIFFEQVGLKRVAASLANLEIKS
jgi:DNA helicase-2/ATP-dependent DNA helicase PcrA